MPTLTPNLGVCSIDNRTDTLADIPGLIEGGERRAGPGGTSSCGIVAHAYAHSRHVGDVSGIEGRAIRSKIHESIMHELAQYSEERPIAP